MSRKKLSLIGGGNIGGTIAKIASEDESVDIVLYDIEGNMAKGKALDIMQMNALLGINTVVHGSSDISDIQDSDAIIITAGLPRRPGGTREELLEVNSKIISSIALDIKKYAPNAFIIVVTNPLDVMVHLMQKESGLPHNRVVGMAGILDAARFIFFLSQEFKVSPANISAMVLGGHGDAMVPLLRYATIYGIKLEDMIKAGYSSNDKLEEIVARTRAGGGEIASLLGKGSAFYAPALSAFQMVKAFLFDEKKMCTASVYLSGEYGFNNVYAGVPVVIGSSGAEAIIELELTNAEKEALSKSVEGVKELINKV